MKNEKFSIRRRLHSFRYAYAGIATLLKDEHNSRIHLVAMLAVAVAGCICGISSQEWCAVIVCFGMVFMAEALNSAVEALADLVMPDPHPLVRKAKDVAAAGVLFTAIASATVGLIIFIPHISRLF